MPSLWFTHPASLEHVIPGHPERRERLIGLHRALDAHGWFGWERVQSPAATRAQLEAVHAPALVDLVESLCRSGGGMIDGDTSVVEASWDAALHAAGGAVAMTDALLCGAADFGFSAHRPPGHHAERDRAMGFCLFDSVAVAAQHALDTGAAERVLIFDWDVHHGNGTNDIFHASPDVLFASVHQSPLYPGTGPATDTGAGAGTGFTLNLPVPPGAGDAAYVSLAAHVVAPLVAGFGADLVLVSAGFDAHHLDPLASCRVTEAGFAAMTAALRQACAEAEVPLGFVLEGGYSVEALADSVCAMLPVLDGGVPAAPDLPVHPLAAAALERRATSA